jgi:hypothetical protein
MQAVAGLGLELESEFIRIAEEPVFTRFDRADNRMFRSVVVLRCVFADGSIAAAYVAAFRAETEMHPALAEFKTLFASMFLRLRDLNRIEM